MEYLLTSDFHPVLTPLNAIRKLTFQIAHQHPYHAAYLLTPSASDSVPSLNVHVINACIIIIIITEGSGKKSNLITKLCTILVWQNVDIW